MAIGEFGASSFVSYEGIRIVIPGIVVSAAGFYAYTTIVPGEGSSTTPDTLLSVVSTLVVGLFLHFWDIPAKSAVFAENQPTDYLEGQFPNKTKAELLTAYFAILNTKMEPATKNRALYQGSMFRIGMESILGLALASGVVFASSVLDYGVNLGHHGRSLRVLGAASLGVVVGVSVLLSRGYERKRAARYGKNRSGAFRRIKDDLVSWNCVPYAIFLLGIAGPWYFPLAGSWSDRTSRVISLVAFGLCIVHWLRWYIVGGRSSAGKPAPIHAVSAGVFLAFPFLVLLLAVPPAQHSVLGRSQDFVLWVAVVSLVVLSTVIRGHERKLQGAYASQRHWLKRHAETYKDILPG